MKKSLVFVLLAAAAGFFAATAHTQAYIDDNNAHPVIDVSHAWTIAREKGITGAPVYLALTNKTGKDDFLVAATSPYAREVRLQDTRYNKLGIALMAPVRKIALKNGKTVTLKPGGLHLMLIDLKQPLVAGMEVPLKLQFYFSRNVWVKATIGLPGDTTDPALRHTGNTLYTPESNTP